MVVDLKFVDKLQKNYHKLYKRQVHIRQLHENHSEEYDQLNAYLLVEEYKNNNQIRDRTYLRIVEALVLYTLNTETNLQKLERHFRDCNSFIRLIARQAQQLPDNIKSVCGKRDCNFDAIVIITDDNKLYQKELEKFGYTDLNLQKAIEQNFQNLQDCGFLVNVNTFPQIYQNNND